LSVANNGSLSPDDGSVEIRDDVPDDLALCITTTCLPGGPVILDASGSPIPPGVTIGSIEYDDSSGTVTYPCAPDADGFDPAVEAIRITLSGTLVSLATSGSPSFDFLLAARVD